MGSTPHGRHSTDKPIITPVDSNDALSAEPLPSQVDEIKTPPVPTKTEAGASLHKPRASTAKHIDRNRWLMFMALWVPMLFTTECYAHGVNAYVVKPVDFQEFENAVTQLGIFWDAINEPPPHNGKEGG